MVTSEIREWFHARFVQILIISGVIRICKKRKWNYSLIIDMFILDRIDRELHSLKSLDLKLKIKIFKILGQNTC